MKSCSSVRALEPYSWRAFRWLFLLLFAGTSQTAPDVYAAETAGAIKRVLIVSTGSRFSVGFPVVEQNAADTLRQLYQGNIEFYSEYLDIIHFPSAGYRRAFRAYLHEKHADDGLDAIILIYVGDFKARRRAAGGNLSGS